MNNFEQIKLLTYSWSTGWKPLGANFLNSPIDSCESLHNVIFDWWRTQEDLEHHPSIACKKHLKCIFKFSKKIKADLLWPTSTVVPSKDWHFIMPMSTLFRMGLWSWDMMDQGPDIFLRVSSIKNSITTYHNLRRAQFWKFAPNDFSACWWWIWKQIWWVWSYSQQTWTWYVAFPIFPEAKDLPIVFNSPRSNSMFLENYIKICSQALDLEAIIHMTGKGHLKGMYE